MIQNKTHIYSCEISFDLLDPGQVVYHPNYLVLCDRARADALKAAGYSSSELWRDGFALALRENTSEYFRPILMGQSIIILTHTTLIKGASLRVTQQIVDSTYLEPLKLVPPFLDEIFEPETKDLLHRVRLLLVCVQLQPFRPARLPIKLVQSLGVDRSV